MPLSVLIPAYNAARTLARALDSVAAQHMPGLDIVVVDDGSTDTTAAVAAAHPTRPRVLAHAANQGSSAALTTALRHAHHDVVAFLDADDEWLPGKLAAQLALLGPATALVATGFAFIDTDGRQAWTYGDEPAARAGPDFWKALLEHSMIAKPSVLTRRSTIARAGGLNAALAVAEDQDLWIRLALTGPVAYLAQPLLRVHATPGSLTARHASPDRDYVLPMVERYLAALADRLTPAEMRHIRARRYAAAARNLTGVGRAREALPYARRAIANGAPALPLLTALGRGLIDPPRTIVILNSFQDPPASVPPGQTEKVDPEPSSG